MNRATVRRLACLLLALLLAAGLPTTASASGIPSGSMRLNDPDTSGNTAFAVENMFPGDAETKDFTVKVNHREPISLYYHADIRPGYEKLAEVLMVRIQIPAKNITLYEGLMADMPSALEHRLTAQETEVVYRITVYLETSVGNDYQFQELVADFRWWYTEEAVPEEPAPATVKLVAEKILDKKYPRGSAFTFLLKDAEGEIIQTVKNRDGIVEFDTMTFTEAGTYTYYISEKSGKDKDIRYDKSVYKVTVTVTEDAETFHAVVTYQKDDKDYKLLPRFVNKTKSSGSGDGSSGTTKPDNPKTGDESHIELYGAVMAGSLAALLFLLIWAKRKKEDKE